MVENQQLWGFFLSCQVPSDLVNLHDFLIVPFSSAVALGHSLEGTYQAWTKSLLRYRLPFRWGVAVPIGQEGSSLTRIGPGCQCSAGGSRPIWCWGQGPQSALGLMAAARGMKWAVKVGRCLCGEGPMLGVSG